MNPTDKIRKNRRVVLISGGQDSSTCLIMEVKRYGADNVFALGFKYGQKHTKEQEMATKLCQSLNVSYKTIDLTNAFSVVSKSKLLQEEKLTDKKHELNKELPASWVENRNAMFLTLAHSFAQKRDCKTIVIGVSQEDYSGYPDCRQDFIHAMELALNLSSDTDIRIKTPLINMTKADTFMLAHENKFTDTILEQTLTCYNGDNVTVQNYGLGCGVCDSCKLREKGWNQFVASVPEKDRPAHWKWSN